MACRTPLREPHRFSRSVATAAICSGSVTSSSRTSGGCGRCLATLRVKLRPRPAPVSTTSAPSAWASAATPKARDWSVSTPVTRMRLPASRPDMPANTRTVCSATRTPLSPAEDRRARPLHHAGLTMPSEDVRRWEREGRGPVIAEPAGQALVVALGEPPMPLDRDVQVVVDAEGVAPLARVPVLAKLDDVEAATGGPVVADANDRVENDELEEVELLDRPADEVAQGYWARKFHDRPGDGVDVDGCIREKEGLQIRPAAPGDHIGVCGLETGDGQVGERVVVHPGSMPAPEPIVATPSRAGCQSVCLRRLK